LSHFGKLLETVPHVVERVRECETRSAPLADELDEVEPPNHSWRQVERAVFGRAQTAASAHARQQWQSASFALFGTVPVLVGVVAKLAHEVAHPSVARNS
jgi:anti-sigma-K factor RskA